MIAVGETGRRPQPPPEEPLKKEPRNLGDYLGNCSLKNLAEPRRMNCFVDFGDVVEPLKPPWPPYAN